MEDTKVRTELNLEASIKGLVNAQKSLFAYVDSNTEMPEGVCFAEAFYHVGDALSLLEDPEVFAAVKAILERRAAAAPVERPELELVGQPF